MSPPLPVVASSFPANFNPEDSLPPLTLKTPSASLKTHNTLQASLNTLPSLTGPNTPSASLNTERTLPASLNLTEDTLPPLTPNTSAAAKYPSLVGSYKSPTCHSEGVSWQNKRRVSSPVAPCAPQVVPCPSLIAGVPPSPSRSADSSRAPYATAPSPHSQVVPCRYHGNPLSRLKRCVGSVETQSLDSFYMVDHKDLEDYPGPTHQTPTGTEKAKKGARESHQSPTKLDRSWASPERERGISLSSSCSSLPSSTASTCRHHSPKPVYVWSLKRLDLAPLIFDHSGKTIEKKFQVKAGGRPKKGGYTLTFFLKLYPNGVNWAQDVSASLHVKVSSSLGQSTSSTLYFGVMVLEGNKKQMLLAQRRRVCKLQQEQEFLLENFLAHDVLKGSQAKSLMLSFHVELSYELGRDWVCIGMDTDIPSYLQ